MHNTNILLHEGELKKNLQQSDSLLETIITCLRIEFATPRVHIRVGGERSTAVQRLIVCRTSRTACLSRV